MAQARGRLWLAGAGAGLGAWLLVSQMLQTAPPDTPPRADTPRQARQPVAPERIEERARVPTPPVRARSSAQAAPLDGTTPLGDARKLLAEAANRLEASAAQSRHWERYQRCAEGGGAHCQAHRDAALYRALPLVGGELAAGARALDARGLAEVTAAFEAAMQSEDELERVGALALLRRSAHLEDVAVPERCFDRLEQRGVAEAQMTLEHRTGRGPVLPPLAGRLGELALDPALDERVRGAALMALSFPATAAEAMRVAEHWLADDRERLLSPLLLRTSIARCGEACSPLLQQLEAHPDLARHGAATTQASGDVL